MNKPRYDARAARALPRPALPARLALIETTPVLKTPALLRCGAFALLASLLGCGAAPTVTPPPPETPPSVEAPAPPATPDAPPPVTPPETPSTPPIATAVPKPS